MQERRRKICVQYIQRLLHASSCGAERIRSYTSLRNALSNESAEKLIHVKSNLAAHTGTALQLCD